MDHSIMTQVWQQYTQQITCLLKIKPDLGKPTAFDRYEELEHRALVFINKNETRQNFG